MQDSHNGREEAERISRSDPHDATGNSSSERGAAEQGVDTADPPAGTRGAAPSTQAGGTGGDSTPGPHSTHPDSETGLGPPAAPAPQHRHVIKPDLRQEEHIKGSHPGDRYVRVGRNVGPFRRKSGGVLAASLETDRPRNRFGRIFNRVKRTLIGLPLSTEQSIHERLTNAKALAVLSSDALSSVAYATEEILRILIVAGAGAFSLALPLGGAIIVLLAIVVTSYRQTIAAYPRGGGSYIVAKDNLGTLPGLAAASSILIGYILTVAVSVSAGVAALYSLFPAAAPYKIEICIGLVILITIANLRGLREAGNIFAVPTYLFIVGMLALVAYGLLRVFLGVGGPIVYVPPPGVFPVGTQALSLVLILRAFTQGSAALTGVEAIADGVPAFRPPEAKNARSTLLWMGGLSIVMFGGITFLASRLQILPSDAETVVSQIARSVFPPLFGANPFWFFIQVVTALILVLAANTAFSDFPRLSYFLARDKFMPHQYAFRGDRLAYSWGIVTLAALASILIIAFKGDTTALIPLYAIGVFSAFTFSQGGMVMRWWRTKTPGWQRNLAVNLIGALTTLGVFLISSITKFQQGTWIVLLLIPAQMAIFLAINRHYRRVESEIQMEAVMPTTPIEYKHTFLVPIAGLSQVAMSALGYARSLCPNVTALHVVEGEDPGEADRFVEEWKKVVPNDDVGLVVIESPFRSFHTPLVTYIDSLGEATSADIITIVIPEFVPERFWEYFLHNQTTLRLKLALLFRPNTVVMNLPYLMGRNGVTRAVRNRRSTMLQFSWIPAVALLAIILVMYFVFAR